MDSLSGSNIEKIDFLPVRFREQSEVRTVNVWRILAVACFAAMVLAGGWMQQRTLDNLETQLVQVTLNHAVSVARTERLAEAKSKLATAQGSAELTTYLKHSWPRSQVLSAIVSPLPQAVRLEEIRFIKRLSNEQRERVAAESKVKERPAGETRAASDPAVEDLKQLRNHVGEAEIVQITGATTDVVALYDYLSEVGRHPLIESAKIESIQHEERRPLAQLQKSSADNPPRRTELLDQAKTTGEAKELAQFRAIIVLRGGYGQPNGPTGPLVPMSEEELDADAKDKIAGDILRLPSA